MSLVPAIQRNLPPGDPNKIPFQFFVVQQKAPNASALANGTVVVHSGILTLLENEAQLASVLGYEIAHATQEHTYRELQYHHKKLAVLRIGSAVAAAYGKRDLANLATLAEAAIRNGYSRSLENQADRIGMEYMIAAGYDPREAPRVWKVMSQRLGDYPTNFFWSNHDNNTTRRSYLMAELKNNYSNLDFDSYKRSSDVLPTVNAALNRIKVIPVRQNSENAAARKASGSVDERAEVRQVPKPQSLALPSSKIDVSTPQTTVSPTEIRKSDIAPARPTLPVQQPPVTAGTASSTPAIIKETAPRAPTSQGRLVDGISNSETPSPPITKVPSPASPLGPSNVSELVVESAPSGASVKVNGSFIGQTPVVLSVRGRSSDLRAAIEPTRLPEPAARLITERVVFSQRAATTQTVPEASKSKNRVQSRIEEPPENGTEVFPKIGRRGSGTIRITNELDADAVVELLRPNGRQFRAIYVHRHMEAAVLAIPAGVYVVAYTVGSGWQKGKLMNVSGAGNIGALEFMQIESSAGVDADHYQVRLTTK
jgi:hypothetical protein